jgi:hypothetical protein
MAEPGRRDRKGIESELDDLGNLKEVERIRGGWRWWWAWALVAGLVFWWAGWGWGTSGGFLWGTRNTPTSANLPVNPAIGTGGAPLPQASGPGVQVLNANNKQAYVGKPFRVDDVQVQNKVNDQTLWIGTKTGPPMLAVLQKTRNSVAGKNITQGKLVDATGTVEKAPPRDQAIRQWALTDEGASRLEQQGAYVLVSRLTMPQGPQP